MTRAPSYALAATLTEADCLRLLLTLRETEGEDTPDLYCCPRCETMSPEEARCPNCGRDR